MCLILFSYKQNEKYPFVLGSNRDEFFKRPTKTAHLWGDYPFLLAGRDLEKMGTWLGVTKSGKIAAVTNYRDPSLKQVGKSRGKLVTNYLTSNISIRDYINSLVDERDLYPGYNILLGDMDELWYYSNIENEAKKLTPGIYGLSNHLLNTKWPKVKKGMDELSQLVNHDVVNVEDIFTLLGNTERALDDELPKTGVSIEWERVLSSLFINTNGYGTRASTVITLDDNKNVSFCEKSFNEQGDIENIVHKEFSILK